MPLCSLPSHEISFSGTIPLPVPICASPATACTLQHCFCSLAGRGFERPLNHHGHPPLQAGERLPLSPIFFCLSGSVTNNSSWWSVQRELSHLSVTIVTSDLGPVFWSSRSQKCKCMCNVSLPWCLLLSLKIPACSPHSIALEFRFMGSSFPFHFKILSEAFFYFQRRNTWLERIYLKQHNFCYHPSSTGCA